MPFCLAKVYAFSSDTALDSVMSALLPGLNKYIPTKTSLAPGSA